MFTNVESTELISSVENIMVELKKRLDPFYVAPQEKAEVDGDNVIQHKGLKLKKVEREAREGDYVKFLDSRSFSTHNNVIYGPAMKFETEGELVVTCIDNVKVLIYKDVYNRTTSTVVVFEPIGHCKPVEYEPPFPEVLKPNEQRALLIKQAKEFVEEHTQKTKPAFPKPLSKLKRGIGYKGYVVEEQFISNAKKRTVVCLMRGLTSSIVRSKGIAKCAPDDVFNEHIGQAIALARALEIEVPEGFLKAVQPDIAVGQVTVTSQPQPYADEPHTIKEYDSNKCWLRSTGGTVHQGLLTILDDTNAEYNNA
ncbi:hypothetical protein [Viridibacillus sp. FSL H8-0110]|uniref:hypothetical protein n=1 Tax=Viridibacillus sp. FSL H8-0110 TaxID=2921376 RepID=UPI0030F8C526